MQLHLEGVCVNLQEIEDSLKGDGLFAEWKKNHPLCFLSHFFVQVSSQVEPKSAWEIGFYNPKNDKITTFIQIKKGFEIKPEEEIFKRKEDPVEPLHLERAQLTLEKAGETCRREFCSSFPKEALGDGFAILQSLQGRTLWNVSCLSRSLKFLNLKVDAVSGEVVSSDCLEMIDKGEK